MPRRYERRAAIGVTIGVVLTAAVIALSIGVTREQKQADLLVGHTREVLETCLRVGADYQDIPMHSERYAVTREPSEERQALDAQARLDRELAHLRDLTRDSPAQRKRIDDLQAVARDGYAYNARIRREHGGLARLRALMNERKVKPLDNVRAMTQRIVDEEQRLLSARQARLDRSFRLTKLAFAAACLMALAGLAGSVLLLLFGARRRAEAERAVEESRERLRSIIEGSRDLIVAIDQQWRVIAVNKTFNEHASRLLARTLREGDDYRSLFPPEEAATRDWNIRTWERALAGEEFETEFEGEIGGAKRFYECTLTSVRDADGRAAGAAMVAREVTARREAELELKRRSEELARSNTELERFAYVASHDLKEPLRMVVSYTQLLERRYKGKLDAEADAFIHYAVDGARRMHELIDGLLEFSRAGRGAEPPQPVPAERALDVALSNLKAALEESGGRVERSPLPTVLFSPLELARVFQNLVGNALKFRGDRAPVVAVSAERRGAEWVFRVADNGIGMDERDKDKIFGLFQRLHTKAKYPGTGLGLAICKRIIEARGGRIWVESKPGEGTTFFFTARAA